MEQFINIVLYPIIYFLLQLFFFRFFNININKVSTIFLILLISLFVGIKTGSYEIVLNLIALNLFVVCFYIFIPGLLNTGPALIIVDLLKRKKRCKKSDLKILFNKNMKSLGIKNRLEINIKTNFVEKKNYKLNLSKKGKILIYFFDVIIKTFRLKPDR